MSDDLIARLVHLARFAEQQANEKDPNIQPSKAWFLETAQTALDAIAALRLAAERGAEGWEKLKALPPKWDGYRAPALDVATLDRARAFLSSVSLVPCVSGGVQLEWHRDGFDIEIEFLPDGRTEMLASAKSSRGEMAVVGKEPPPASPASTEVTACGHDDADLGLDLAFELGREYQRTHPDGRMELKALLAEINRQDAPPPPAFSSGESEG